jgi:hypothetical protein
MIGLVALFSLFDGLSSISGLDIALFSLLVAIFALFASLIANWYSSRQVRLSSVVLILKRMEDIRDDRQILYKIPKDKPYEEWTKTEKDSADRVARAFDILGVLDSTRNIDRRFVDRFYAIPAKQIWDIIATHVEFKRKEEKREEHHFWEFERLADRVKYVKQNHPAYHNKKKWPPFPRRKRPYLIC